MKQLTIGFDAKRAVKNRTGLGNYSRFVLNGLCRSSEVSQLNLYTPCKDERNCLDGLDLQPKVAMRYPSGGWRGLLSSVWRIWGMVSDLRRANLSLFHGLSNELPLNISKAGVPSVVTIHDLIFLRFPHSYGCFDRLIYNYKFKKACERATRIVAVSECTKRDIVELYRIAPEKIDVVYQGCADNYWHQVSDTSKDEVRSRLNLPARYVLYVGSIEWRKNLMLLAKALKHLPLDVNVVAIGKRTSYANEVDSYLEANGLSGRLRMLSGVKSDDLPAIYQMADVFVYPSRYEGFGIPVLEALVSGVPVVACSGSCLEEAGGPGSIYVEPDDDIALAEAVASVWESPKVRDEMSKVGRIYAEGFRQEKLTADMLSVYNKCFGL